MHELILPLHTAEEALELRKMDPRPLAFQDHHGNATNAVKITAPYVLEIVNSQGITTPQGKALTEKDLTRYAMFEYPDENVTKAQQTVNEDHKIMNKLVPELLATGSFRFLQISGFSQFVATGTLPESHNATYQFYKETGISQFLQAILQRQTREPVVNFKRRLALLFQPDIAFDDSFKTCYMYAQLGIETFWIDHNNGRKVDLCPWLHQTNFHTIAEKSLKAPLLEGDPILRLIHGPYRSIAYALTNHLLYHRQRFIDQGIVKWTRRNVGVEDYPNLMNQMIEKHLSEVFIQRPKS